MTNRGETEGDRGKREGESVGGEGQIGGESMTDRRRDRRRQR